MVLFTDFLNPGDIPGLSYPFWVLGKLVVALVRFRALGLFCASLRF